MREFLKQEIAEKTEFFSPLPPRPPVQKLELGSAGNHEPRACRAVTK
jgi:hypothetical protein